MRVKQEYGESGESLVRKFMKKFKKSELLDFLLERRFYKKPSEIKKENERQRLRTLEKLKQENQDSKD